MSKPQPKTIEETLSELGLSDLVQVHIVSQRGKVKLLDFQDGVGAIIWDDPLSGSYDLSLNEKGVPKSHHRVGLYCFCCKESLYRDARFELIKNYRTEHDLLGELDGDDRFISHESIELATQRVSDELKKLIERCDLRKIYARKAYLHPFSGEEFEWRHAPQPRPPMKRVDWLEIERNPFPTRTFKEIFTLR